MDVPVANNPIHPKVLIMIDENKRISVILPAGYRLRFTTEEGMEKGEYIHTSVEFGKLNIVTSSELVGRITGGLGIGHHHGKAKSRGTCGDS